MVKSVLFICLGNICRSPIAEAVFLDLIEKRGVSRDWAVDSAALGPWHVGNSPDSRAMKTLKDRQVAYSHRARQITQGDFTRFDYILGMDEENIQELEEMKPSDSTASVALLGSWDPQGETIIEDPYYQRGDKGFVKCFEQCRRSCEAFLEQNK